MTAQELIALLKKPESQQTSEFPKVFEAALTALRMNDQQAADLLGVSRPTIGRWKAGKNLPYRLARKPALDLIRKELQKQARVEKKAQASLSQAPSAYSPPSGEDAKLA